MLTMLLATLLAGTARAEAPMKNGPTFGLSVGVATGVGPTLGLPLGQWGRAQFTFLPIAIPENGAGGSAGLRFQQYLGRNPRSRLYLVQGVGVHGWIGQGALWGGGLGLGVETRKDASSGRTIWADITATGIVLPSRSVLLLPLPQVGIAWQF